MTRNELLAFARRHPLAVQASVSPEGDPQAAVIGIVVDDRFQFFFDTLATSRKCRNLRRDPRIALVIGWDLTEACTLQVQGRADEPGDEELARWKALYFARTGSSGSGGRTSRTSASARPGPAPRLPHCGSDGGELSEDAQRPVSGGS